MRKEGQRFVFHGTPPARDAENFTVHGFGHEFYTPPTRCNRPRGSQMDSVMYTIDGSVAGSIGGTRTVATAGTLWIIPREMAFRWRVDPQTRYWEGYWVEFRGRWVRPLWAMLGLTGRTVVSGCTEALPIMEEMLACLKSKGDAALHEASASLWRLFVAAEAALETGRKRVDPAREAVERARAFAQQHFPNRLGVADLARAARLSPCHFSRVFRRECGVTPAAYVRSLRMNYAQRLLRENRMNIKQIAPAVGYPSVAHFSNVFRSHTGLSPGRFARIHGAR